MMNRHSDRVSNADVVLRPDDTSEVSEITFPAAIRRQTSDTSSANGGGSGSRVSQNWRDEMQLEDAEQALLHTLDSLRPKPNIDDNSDDDGFRPSVPGERPPLNTVLGRAFDIEQGHPEHAHHGQTTAPPALSAKPKVSLSDIAKRVRLAQRVGMLKKEQSASNVIHRPTPDSVISSMISRTPAQHRRVATLLESINEDANSVTTSKNSVEQHMTGDIGQLLHDTPEREDSFGSHYSPAPYENSSRNPFVSSAASSSSGVQQEREHPNENQPLLGSAEPPSPTKKTCCYRMSRVGYGICHPAATFTRVATALHNSFIILAIPMFALALILFYGFHDPELDFLPGNAGVAWWLNFLGRQLLLLDCARFSQWVIIDCLTLGSKFMVNLMGPWATIFMIQSKGWPFVFAFWGVWDLCLLHGDNDFQRHWLYFTGIKIYSGSYSGRIDGRYIINSDIYLHLLISLVIAGLATAIKRTAVSVYFGSRNFAEYKPRLESILNDIIIISEVAELAESADTLPEEYGVSKKEMLAENLNKNKKLANVRWSSVRFSYDAEEADQEETNPRGRLDSAEFHKDVQKNGDRRDLFAKSLSRNKKLMQASSRDSSGKLRIRNLLDRWDEPINKNDKAINSTINDILKFRKALTYMDLQHPFSAAFGLASTRDQCIGSAQNVYQRLLKLSPGSKVLSFDFLRVLAMEEDGNDDKIKMQSIRRLFRPDASNELPLIAFIQSCDAVYKRLRYFRASVGNSSVIDRVLEGIIDAVFGFILSLVILQFNSFNPYPILVSMSTLMVTFAFAVGPSAAKSIEGILVITSRRPFDIGDRIIISDSPGAAPSGDNSIPNSWFVEDITVFNTTLRCASSNEVATIGNSSLASSRIINCARSANALVNIYLKLNLKIQDEQNLELYRENIDDYVSNNPRIWDVVVAFRCEEINMDFGFAVYKLVVRSRYSWQVAPRVQQNRAELWQFCAELAKHMNVMFFTPVPSMKTYQGTLEDMGKPLASKSIQTPVSSEEKC